MLTPYKWYARKPRHSRTHTSHIRRQRHRNNADTHHRQRSTHVIVATATPATTHTPTLPLSHRIKKEWKKKTQKTWKQARKNSKTHTRAQVISCLNVDFKAAFLCCAHLIHVHSFNAHLLAMFRVMRAEFGYWLIIRVEWFGQSMYCSIHAYSPHMHTNSICIILVVMYPNCYMLRPLSLSRHVGGGEPRPCMGQHHGYEARGPLGVGMDDSRFNRVRHRE